MSLLESQEKRCIKATNNNYELGLTETKFYAAATNKAEPHPEAPCRNLKGRGWQYLQKSEPRTTGSALKQDPNTWKVLIVMPAFFQALDRKTT